MRNLFILAATLAGAWFMGQASVSLGATLAEGATGFSPMSGLLIAPATLFGAFVGSLLGGVLSPWAR